MTATARVALLALLALGCGAMRSAPQPSGLRRDAERAAARAATAFGERRWAAAAIAFGRAADVFAALDDGAAEAIARHGQAEALRRDGRLDAALAANQRALALDTRTGDTTARARDLVGLAQTQRARGDLASAIVTAEEARPLARDAPAVAATVENDLATYLLARSDPGDRQRILDLLEAARRTNRARKDTRGVAVNELNLGRAHLSAGDPAGAAAPLASALEAFRALDDPEGLAGTHEALGMVAASRGDRAESAAHYRQARDTFAFLGAEPDRRRLERRLAGE